MYVRGWSCLTSINCCLLQVGLTSHIATLSVGGWSCLTRTYCYIWLVLNAIYTLLSVSGWRCLTPKHCCLIEVGDVEHRHTHHCLLRVGVISLKPTIVSSRSDMSDTYQLLSVRGCSYRYVNVQCFVRVKRLDTFYWVFLYGIRGWTPTTCVC